MNKKLLAFTALSSTSFLFVPGAANAQMAAWNGAYVGFGTGGAFVGDAVTTDIHGDATLNQRGTVFSVITGFNWGTPAGFFGVEADVNFLGAPNALGTTTGGAEVTTNLDQLMTVRARAGFAIGPRTMLFATGGLAVGNAGLSTSYTDMGKTSSGTGRSYLPGFAAGGGIEFAIAESVRLRSEALYYRLAPLTVNASGLPPAVPYTATSRPSGFIVRVGITADLN
jgi:outer membrane immunogenic protein